MLVVRLDLWPYGSEARGQELGRMYIANVGGTDERANYIAAVCRDGTRKVPREIYADRSEDIQAVTRALPSAARHGRVRDYPRLELPGWHLVGRSLKACFPEMKLK